MAHLLTWTRIRLLARPSTIYSRYREGKHHFRWLLRWRNLPVRASPPSSPMLRLTAYLRLASCLSTPGWMCIGIEYRQATLSPSLLYRSYSSVRSLFLPHPFRSLTFFHPDVVRHRLLVFEIFCQFLWKLRPDRSNRFSLFFDPSRLCSPTPSYFLFTTVQDFLHSCLALSSLRWVAMP